MQLFDYVKVYRNAIPSKDCDNLVAKFDDSLTESHYSTTYSFKQINLNHHPNIFGQDVVYFLSIFNKLVDDYRKTLNIKYFPKTYGLEEFRIKKYRADDYFKEHVDVCDGQTCKRFLSVFVYLNNGGGTKFLDKVVESKKGTVVIFPPLWLFPHQGIVSGEKYFLSTYLHYVLPSL